MRPPSPALDPSHPSPSSPTPSSSSAAAAAATAHSHHQHQHQHQGSSTYDPAPSSLPPVTLISHDSDGVTETVAQSLDHSVAPPADYPHSPTGDPMTTQNASWPSAPSSPSPPAQSTSPLPPLMTDSPTHPSLPISSPEHSLLASTSDPALAAHATPHGFEFGMDSDSDSTPQAQQGDQDHAPPPAWSNFGSSGTQVGALPVISVPSFLPTPWPIYTPVTTEEANASITPVYQAVNEPVPAFPPPQPGVAAAAPDDSEVEPQYHPNVIAPQPMSLGPDNMGLSDFIRLWSWSNRNPPHHSRAVFTHPSIMEWRKLADKGPRRIEYRDLKGDACDLQGIDWEAIGVTRNSARRRRLGTYHNYVNVVDSDKDLGPLYHAKLPRVDDFYRFRSMDLKRRVRLLHFQLRNLVGCSSKDGVFYPAGGVIQQLNPATGKSRSAMIFENEGDAHVSTLAVADDILLVGGFYGDYHYRCLRSSRLEPIEGRLTSHISGITNHVQLHTARRSNTPLAAFASNDSGFRVVDLAENKLIQENMFPYALNCSALSADRRLRVMVGDCREVLITDAERGGVVQQLTGHQDFGFACDWAPDGWTVATGNQDKTVRIWDARKWTRSDGRGCPVKVIRSEMSGPRSLHFSPLGSGKRVLVAAEEADMISIIDASTFETTQTIDIFGEIGGVSFTNHGQSLAALCADGDVGGILHLDRTDDGAENMYNFGESDSCFEEKEELPRLGYDWLRSPGEIMELPGSQETITQRKRRAAVRHLASTPF